LGNPSVLIDLEGITVLMLENQLGIKGTNNPIRTWRRNPPDFCSGFI